MAAKAPSHVHLPQGWLPYQRTPHTWQTLPRVVWIITRGLLVMGMIFNALLLAPAVYHSADLDEWMPALVATIACAIFWVATWSLTRWCITSVIARATPRR